VRRNRTLGRIFRILGRSIPILGLLATVGFGSMTAHAAADEARPYDDKLQRLTEILGAVHFLRELCGADEGQRWRKQMADLMEADGGSGLRKLRLTNSFNKGYRSYRRTYQTCNSSAQNQLTRFLAEGADLAKALGNYKP
jgi:uncharacterized protein (TIGR02301 family)